MRPLRARLFGAHDSVRHCPVASPLVFGLAIGLGLGLSGCGAGAEKASAVYAVKATAPPAEGLAKATFAGGCFWCMEHPFDELPGVVSTTSGYTGGTVKNPSYEQVSAGRTGHLESVEVLFDPAKVRYEELLEVFWHNVDPTDRGGQFCDRGPQYTTAIFVHGEQQRRAAEASKEELRASGRFSTTIATVIGNAGPFYPAEEHHQNFYQEHPVRYRVYRTGCGRDHRLHEIWGDAAGH